VIGAVIMQEGKPLSIFIEGLGPVNSALSIYEKEAMENLQALKNGAINSLETKWLSKQIKRF
jgi:hypothetical protein